MTSTARVFEPIIAARREGRLLRFAADGWALLYLGVASGLFLFHWHLVSVQLPLVLLACAMAYGCGCILHNHAHLPFWRSRTLNLLTACWIALLRGDGVWSWLPTHVGNHHRFANHRGDLTLTWRWGHGNHPLGLLAYSLTGCVLYVGCAMRYLIRHPRVWVQPLLYAAFLCGALLLDAQRAFWLIIVPQAFGIVAMIATGYMQHHHADEDSAWSHSRDFTGRLNNWLHFNHGFHSVHHHDRRLHWSEWPRAHELIAHRLDPRLIEPSLPRYLLRLLGSPWIRVWRTIDLSSRRPEPAS